MLHERTLVLNKHWTAVTTTTVRTALVLLYRESARVICPDTYEAFDLMGWIDRSMTVAPPGPDDEYVCFEPMTAPVNALAGDDGVPSVPPGGSFRAEFSIRVA